MKIRKMIPIITLRDFKGIKEFYQNHFDFKVTFEAEEFLSLSAKNREEIEISFMKPCNDEQPEFDNKGLTYCFEVDDVDSEYSRLQNESVNILQPVRDNPWGDRSFIVSAPAGISIFVYSLIPPTEEYKQYYKS